MENETFPSKAAVNIHPQRWNDDLYEWTKEFVMQHVKNVAKLGFIAVRNSNLKM